MAQRPPLSLKGRALRLLSGREHSRAELERKLGVHEEEPGQLRRVLDDLQAKGFIDDQRAADSVVHRRAARLGALRIRQELQGKGIADELVRDAVAALQASEFTRAHDIWQRKFGEAPGTDTAQRARQMRFLAARGFSGEVVAKVMKAARLRDD